MKSERKCREKVVGERLWVLFRPDPRRVGQSVWGALRSAHSVYCT